LEVKKMKYARYLFTGLSILLLLTMTLTPAVVSAKGRDSGSGKSTPLIIPVPGSGGGGGSDPGGNSGPKGNTSEGNPVHSQNFVVHTPTTPQNFVTTQNFVKTGNPISNGLPKSNKIVTQNLIGQPGTFDPKGKGPSVPLVTQNLVVKPGIADPKGQPTGLTVQSLTTKPGATTLNGQTLSALKTTLANQKLTTLSALKSALNKSSINLTQQQLQTLFTDLKTNNLKDPTLTSLNLTGGEIQQLIKLVSQESGATDAQVDAAILALLQSFSSQSSGNNNNEENNDEDDDENNESSPAPAIVYPYSYFPVYNYSYIPNTSNSEYVDGFGPVPVMSVQLSTGQTVVIPAPPYNPNMVWGQFGTYANWAAQFSASHGGVGPTQQDQTDFWISQAISGQLRISPTP
jgi:hypothetical protein